MALLAGLTIADRFRLRRLVGVGGTGWVWEAKDVQTNDYAEGVDPEIRHESIQAKAPDPI